MTQSNQESRTISVLLVDDHKMLLDLWELVLSKYEHIKIIGKATDGRTAIELCKALKPGIVVQDLNIGQPDGFEVIKEIRRLSPLSKIVVVTMLAQPAYAKKLMMAGASGFVTKSSEIDELVNAIFRISSGGTYVCKSIRDYLVKNPGDDDEDHVGANSLTLREIEIIKLLRQGMTSKEIAEKIYLTPKTVELHRYHILRKLNIKNTACLISFAIENCL